MPIPNIKSIVRAIKRPISIAEKAGIPKGERKYLTSWDGWSQGGPISNKHLIEYALIDNDLWRSKQKIPTWIDRRSIIQLNSKDGKKLMPNIFYTGVNNLIDPQYNGILWLTRDGLSARAYTDDDNGVMQIVIPKMSKINTIDAKGSPWFSLGRYSGGWTNGYRTNDFVSDSFNKGFDVAEIKNVVDIGPKHVPAFSKFNYFTSKLDFLQRPLIQTDIVIKPDFPRKSIIGNNGDFDLENKSLFEKNGGRFKNILKKK